jgi:hypothetical protein
MLLRSSLGGIAVVTTVAVLGCGDEVRVQADDDGAGASGAGGANQGGSGAGASSSGTQPPAPVDGAPAGDGSGYVLAMDSMYLGENGNDWKNIGYNLDGRISDGTDITLCKPYGGVNPKTVHTDGNGGIDNAFGGNLLGIITTLVMAPSAEMTAEIAAGRHTLIWDLANLGLQPSYLGIDAYMNFGAPLGAPPAFDGSDAWPVLTEFLTNPSDPKSTLFHFPSSYVTDHVWVSGVGSFHMQLPLSEMPLTLPVERGVITMRLAPDRLSATNGIIAGVLPVEPFLDEIAKMAGTFDPSFCEGSTVENIKDQMRQAADMMVSGDHDPSKVCDGISIGIAFTAKPVQIGGTDDGPPLIDPCSTP